jgi:hypothetical protein
MDSPLESAQRKLMGFIRFENLPTDRIEPAWDRIERECNLTLEELVVLKNAKCAPPAQPQGMLLTSNQNYYLIL